MPPLMKFNTPIPQPLQKECAKAANIFKSFVDSANHGLDGIIPRHVLENAKGFAIFTVFKAGFVLSARAGSGVVIAKLPDGSWSAPSAIGTAGMGFGGQLGAEVTDFLIVLNSSSAVKSFMAAGSLSLGGNMSVAVGPLGRNGEASGAVNTSGKIATMYSYSKTKGLFGGVSLEGSIIVERQDANAIAYNDDVTAKQLLSGAVPPPEWASVLIKTLESCTGLPGGRKWVDDSPRKESPAAATGSYAFQGYSSPGRQSKKMSGLDSPWSSRKTDSYFPSDLSSQSKPTTPAAPAVGNLIDFDDAPQPAFKTHFQSDFASGVAAFQPTTRLTNVPASQPVDTSSVITGIDQINLIDNSPLPKASSLRASYDGKASTAGSKQPPFLTKRADLVAPLNPSEGVGRAIALHDFDAVEPGDLSFSKGDIILIVKKTDRTNDWWRGRVGLREGNFPANYVEVA